MQVLPPHFATDLEQKAKMYIGNGCAINILRNNCLFLRKIRSLMKKWTYILAFLFFSALLSAQGKDDFGIWSSLTSSFRVADKWKVGVMAEHRSLDNARGLDCAYVMPSVEYRPFKFMKAGYASEIVMCGDKTTQLTFRPYVTFILGHGPLQFSVRELPIGEYTFETKQMKWTSRTMFKVSYAIESIKMEPYCSYEIFIGGKGWEKSRHYIGSEIAIWKFLYADVYYMYYLMSGKASRHVLGLGLGVRL